MDRVRKGSGFTVISADDRVNKSYWLDRFKWTDTSTLQRTEVLMGENSSLLHLTKIIYKCCTEILFFQVMEKTTYPSIQAGIETIIERANVGEDFYLFMSVVQVSFHTNPPDRRKSRITEVHLT